MDLDLLVGVERQKKTILNNTVNFSEGNFTNNALLWGSRGNGKSSLIKSVFNEVNKKNKNLKLIQLNKNNIFDIEIIYAKYANFKNFNFIILKDHEFKKLNNQLESSNALINCPRKYFNEKLVKRFTNMDWVHTSAAGVDAFINPSFSNLEVCFTNGKILQGPEVADHAIGIILSFSRNVLPKLISGNLSMGSKFNPNSDSEYEGRFSSLIPMGELKKLGKAL